MVTIPPIAERDTRQRKIRELMKRQGVDVLLIASDAQMHHRGYLRYVSFWRTPSWEDYMIFPVDGAPAFFTHYGLRAKLAKEVYGIDNAYSPSVGASHDTYVPYLVEEIKKHKPNTVGLVSSQTMSGEFYKALTRELTGCKITESSQILDEVRSVKSEEELKLYRRSAECMDIAYSSLLKALKPGRKEYQAVADAEHDAKLNGAEEVFYMIGSGPTPELKYNGMMDRTLQNGDLVVFTLEIAGPGGYWTELSRAVSIGPPKQSVIDVYKVVDLAKQRAVEMLRPGNTAGDIAKVILDNVKGKGYAMMGQALGHAAGLDIYEPPLIALGDNMPLKAGMVIAVHPHALTNDGAGVIICDNYQVTSGESKRMFGSSSELEVV